MRLRAAWAALCAYPQAVSEVERLALLRAAQRGAEVAKVCIVANESALISPFLELGYDAEQATNRIAWLKRLQLADV